ncbi:MAG: ABC transporter ATP-binding protein [Bacteroidales bacterium]
MENIIECNNLTHYYGSRKIYEDLSFTVPKGKILGLLGKNGTGKTTTINILSGYLKPKAGECKIFGHDITTMDPAVKRRIGLLLEGHVQYTFMSIEQIEKFYAPFYPNWNRDIYYELMRKLKVAPNQKISNMSCGQRSQVALGIILAQNPELLILDDFSLGLDPGYRRLFIDILREYAVAEGKTIFVTSHIIQDMERFVDECIIMDYGRILVQDSLDSLYRNFKCFEFNTDNPQIKIEDNLILNSEQIRNHVKTYTFQDEAYVREMLNKNGIGSDSLRRMELSLEDIFIGLTGKY